MSAKSFSFFQGEMCKRDLSKTKSSRVFSCVKDLLQCDVGAEQDSLCVGWTAFPHPRCPSRMCSQAPRLSGGAGDGGPKGSVTFGTGSASLPEPSVPSWGVLRLCPPTHSSLQCAGLKLPVWDIGTL